MDELKHECGLAAVYFRPTGESSALWPGSPDRVTDLMPRMLLDLQNRGQLAAGFSSFKPDREQLLETYKELGTVSEAFRMTNKTKYDTIMEEHAGVAAVGHTRYATCGPTNRSYAQPFERRHGCKWKWFSFAFNGNLANYEQLKKEALELEDYHLTRDNDTEIIQHLIAHALECKERPDLVKVFGEIAKKLDGAYNLVFLNAMGDMVVLRDPLGLRPLCFATDGPLFAAASESVPLLNMGFPHIQSLPPGEMLVIQNGHLTQHRFAPARKPAHCFFEWIYFANVASTLDEKSVYLSRSRLGEELAKMERDRGLFDFDDGNTIVVPVPDTGKAAADAMGFHLNLRVQEGLIRNRYVGRTFIEAGNRAEKVRIKFTPLREVLEGKRVILVEDSIVRSTTLKTLLGFLREAGGVKEIHVRVACPPIIAPCFYGIDMSTVKQLYAPKFMSGPEPTKAELAAMAADLGAESLMYLPLDAVARSIGVTSDRLCRACITGSYPTEMGKQRYELELAK